MSRNINISVQGGAEDDELIEFDIDSAATVSTLREEIVVHLLGLEDVDELDPSIDLNTFLLYYGSTQLSAMDESLSTYIDSSYAEIHVVRVRHRVMKEARTSFRVNVHANVIRKEPDSDDDSTDSDSEYDDEVEEQVDGSMTLDGLIEKFKQDGFLKYDSQYEIRDSRQILIPNQSNQVCSITLPHETLFLTFVEIEDIEIDLTCYVHPLIEGEYGGRILTVSANLNNYLSDVIDLLEFDTPVMLVLKEDKEETIMKKHYRLKTYVTKPSEVTIKVLPDLLI